MTTRLNRKPTWAAVALSLGLTLEVPALLGCTRSLPERLGALPARDEESCDVAFTDALHSLISGPTQAESRVIVDRSEWCRFWSVVRPTEECDTSLVDFDREAAVLVAIGTRPRGGYDVTITGIRGEKESGAIQVLFTETIPGAGCATLQMINYPVDVVKISRPLGPATFEKSVAIHDCE